MWSSGLSRVYRKVKGVKVARFRVLGLRESKGVKETRV